MQPRSRRAVAVTAAVLALAGCAPAAKSTTVQSPEDPAVATSPLPETAPDRPRAPIPEVPVDGIVPAPGAALDAYAQQTLTWRECGLGDRNFECARVAAPFDYADPGRQAITLTMLKVPATKQPRLGTLFVNPGGPGEPGTMLAARFQRTGLEQYDIIGWDPRGTGLSTPVRCGDPRVMDTYLTIDNSPEDAAEKRAYEQASKDLGAACLAGSGTLLEHISTLDTTRDLDLLRDLVGDERLNYFGYSYGTRIGANYAELFPQRTGRLVLDGAVDITGGGEIVQAMGFERALTDWAKWCAANQCGLGKDADAVLQRVTGLLDRLDKRPLQVGQRQLTQSLAVTGVIVPLYGGQDSWRALSIAVGKADDGNGQPLLALADTYNTRRQDGSYDNRAYAFPAIRCIDKPDAGIAGADRDARATDSKAPTIGRYLGPDYVCPQWPAPPRQPLQPVGRGAAPILVVGTTGDSATPYEHAKTMADQLESASLLTYKGAGHGAYGGKSACVDDAVVRYLTGTPLTGDRTCDR